MSAVKTSIIKIGNSKGIRIPKPLLDQAALGEEVELEAGDGQIVVRSSRHTRHDWDEQFTGMAERKDDGLLDTEAPSLTNWDAEEWEW
jgi:antitoxin MazE